MNMFNSIVYYVLIGMMVATYSGNLDSKFDKAHKIKSTLYWPAYAMNYFNAVSEINKADKVQIRKEMREYQKHSVNYSKNF